MNNIWFDKIHPEQSRKRDELAMGLGILSLGVVAPIGVTYRQEIAVRIIVMNLNEFSSLFFFSYSGF